MELFTPVTGYEGFYSVSRTGKVWSERARKILKPATDRYGYHYYVFCVNGVRKTLKEHRLVAETYISNPLSKPTVDHKNGNKIDNRVENLQWATNKEQSNNPTTYPKLAAIGRNKFRMLAKQNNYNRKPVAVYRDGTLVGQFGSLLSAANAVGISYSRASMCANGHCNKAGGYVFRWVAKEK